jgi:hypothetical protein
MRNFHLPLPREVYDALRDAAAAAGRPATVVAREAIEAWLAERRRMVMREAIASYAARHGGTSVDLDPDLETAALEILRPRTRRR